MFTAHEIGVNSVSWAPAYSPGSATQKNGPTQLSKRLVSGGCDNAVKIWK
jgi:protein transport protein SEC13